MDERTGSYYAAFAGELAEGYEAAQPEIERMLQVVFRPGGSVLDVGAGTGRDVACLLRMGYDAYGIEPCTEFRSLALKYHPQLAGRLEAAELPNLGRPFDRHFDGLLCSGVLSHVGKERLAEASASMRALLAKGGRLLLTMPLAPLDVDESDRDRCGRLITPLDPEQVRLLFERERMQQVQSWEFIDALERRGCSWCALLFETRG